MALTLLAVAQVPEGGDSLESTYARTRAQLSRQAGSAGGSTVLAYDRGVTELVRRYAELWLALEGGRARVGELVAVAAAARAIDSADFTEQGRAHHADRLRRSDADVVRQRDEVERNCTFAAAALAELRGRVAGKVDSLFAAEGACASLAPRAPASLCALVPETRAAYEALFAAARGEGARLAAVCTSPAAAPGTR